MRYWYLILRYQSLIVGIRTLQVLVLVKASSQKFEIGKHVSLKKKQIFINNFLNLIVLKDINNEILCLNEVSYAHPYG